MIEIHFYFVVLEKNTGSIDVEKMAADYYKTWPLNVLLVFLNMNCDLVDVFFSNYSYWNMEVLFLYRQYWWHNLNWLFFVVVLLSITFKMLACLRLNLVKKYVTKLSGNLLFGALQFIKLCTAISTQNKLFSSSKTNYWNKMQRGKLVY